MELLDEELTSETLRQALAFIDAYELSTSSSEDQDALADSPTSPSISSPERDPAPIMHRSTPAPIVRTRKRHDTKKELEQLRVDVQTLEATLESLKSGSLQSITTATALRSTALTVSAQHKADKARKEMEAMWMDMAVRQSRRRQHSEATNRQLKRAIGKQLKVAKYLEALLARRTLSQDIEASCDSHLSNFRHLQFHSRGDDIVFAHLLLRSQQLYAAMDLYVEQAGLQAISLPLRTLRKQDPIQGTVYETASSTPVPFSFQQTDAAIWGGLFQGEIKDRPILNHLQNRTITEEGLRKNYLTTFQHDHSTYDLHSRTVLRKYKERDRIVYTWTTVTVLGSKGIRVISQSMMVMAPSPSLPENATVLKKWNRLYVDQMEGSSKAAQPLVEKVLKTLSGNTATTWAWLENHLLGDPCANRPPCART